MAAAGEQLNGELQSTRSTILLLFSEKWCRSSAWDEGGRIFYCIIPAKGFDQSTEALVPGEFGE